MNKMQSYRSTNYPTSIGPTPPYPQTTLILSPFSTSQRKFTNSFQHPNCSNCSNAECALLKLVDVGGDIPGSPKSGLQIWAPKRMQKRIMTIKVEQNYRRFICTTYSKMCFKAHQNLVIMKNIRHKATALLAYS